MKSLRAPLDTLGEPLGNLLNDLQERTITAKLQARLEERFPDFPKDFHDSASFPCVFDGFPKVFEWFSWGFQLVSNGFQWEPHAFEGFPLVFRRLSVESRSEPFAYLLKFIRNFWEPLKIIRKPSKASDNLWESLANLQEQAVISKLQARSEGHSSGGWPANVSTTAFSTGLPAFRRISNFRRFSHIFEGVPMVVEGFSQVPEGFQQMFKGF